MLDGSRIAPAEAARELLHRRRCRADLLTFASHAVAPLGLAPAAHHRRLLAELQHVADTPGARLMVFMPPGSAKSTYGSVVFPAWLLSRRGMSLIGASHTATLAHAFSGRVQGMIRDNAAVLGYRLATESRERWLTSNDGQYLSVGVGGPMTGTRGDVVLVDDPVKSRADADSQTYRDTAWNWFSADLTTRLKPGGRIVLVMTRWHEDDLAGRLLATQADRWRVLNLPAIAEAGDALGRAPGEPLWSDDAYGFGADLLAKREAFEASGQGRDWASLYQQRPRPMEGALFKTAMLGTMEAAPPGRNMVRAWDLAATAQTGTRDPDWTVGVKLLRTDGGSMIVMDVVRDRVGPDGVEAMILATAQRDGAGVLQSLPQDPGQAGKAQVQYLTRRLAGYRVHSSPETGDKATRAAPAASQVNVGNVAMIRAHWNAAFVDELAAFPSGAKDDQVDAFSRAFGMLATGRAPMRISADALAAVGAR